MGLFSDKPYTAITSGIERLSGRSGSNEDASDLLELIETIQIAKIDGTTEAGRALRKQLKHGSAKQQVRALWLLEMLIDNGGKEMPRVLDDPGLGDQVVLLARSGEKRPKAAAQQVLKGWEQRDHRLSSWTDQFRGVRTSASASSSRYAAEHHEPSPGRSHARSRSRNDRSPSPRRPPSRSPSPINVRGASIASTLATSHTIATRLSESVITHPRLRESREAKGYYSQAKEIRKRVINLIHKDSPEVQEFLDRLLVVNEELIASLQGYEDALARPVSRRSPSPRRAPPSPRPRPSAPASPRRSPSPRPSPPRSSSPDDDPFGDNNEADDVNLQRPMW